MILVQRLVLISQIEMPFDFFVLNKQNAYNLGHRKKLFLETSGEVAVKFSNETRFRTENFLKCAPNMNKYVLKSSHLCVHLIRQRKFPKKAKKNCHHTG